MKDKLSLIICNLCKTPLEKQWKAARNGSTQGSRKRKDKFQTFNQIKENLRNNICYTAHTYKLNQTQLHIVFMYCTVYI